MLVLNHILLLFADDEAVLTTKDLEWYAENLTVPQQVPLSTLNFQKRHSSQANHRVNVKGNHRLKRYVLYRSILSCFSVSVSDARPLKAAPRNFRY